MWSRGEGWITLATARSFLAWRDDIWTLFWTHSSKVPSTRPRSFSSWDNFAPTSNKCPSWMCEERHTPFRRWQRRLVVLIWSAIVVQLSELVKVSEEKLGNDSCISLVLRNSCVLCSVSLFLGGLSWNNFVRLVFGFFGLLFSMKTRSAKSPSFCPLRRALKKILHFFVVINVFFQKTFLLFRNGQCLNKFFCCLYFRHRMKHPQSNDILINCVRGAYRSFYTRRDVICWK